MWKPRSEFNDSTFRKLLEPHKVPVFDEAIKSLPIAQRLVFLALIDDAAETLFDKGYEAGAESTLKIAQFAKQRQEGKGKF